MEMKAQIMADVIPIYVAPIPSMLHQNNIAITYAGTSRMERVRFMPMPNL
jgi:hypothetical protein